MDPRLNQQGVWRVFHLGGVDEPFHNCFSRLFMKRGNHPAMQHYLSHCGAHSTNRCVDVEDNQGRNCLKLNKNSKVWSSFLTILIYLDYMSSTGLVLPFWLHMPKHQDWGCRFPAIVWLTLSSASDRPCEAPWRDPTPQGSTRIDASPIVSDTHSELVSACV
jgi:hypothetical protein